ncbi:MAG: nuclear transport factor 2 family protein [Immundisolibacterales bacterium]|nr:nuclear transport factor 2 family protein [Immundisolibacterales bacterium]
MEKQALEELAIRFTDAFNRDDLDGVMSFFAEESVYDEFHGMRHEGRDAIRAAFEPQFRGAYGEVRFDQEDLFADAEAGKVLISWTCTMTTRKGPGGWRGLDILHFADGKLVEKQTYAKAKVPLLNPVDP